jgi:hypothetical protein
MTNQHDHDEQDCPMDGCGGHVFTPNVDGGNVSTPNVDADDAAYEAKPNLGMDAWKREIEESGKGMFVTAVARPRHERGGRTS